MGNLEHKIKEAFAAQDAKTILADKEVMWKRLDNQKKKRTGVVAFWRVAAVLLGFILFTGAFATVNSRIKQQNKIEKIEMENARLTASVDSLVAILRDDIKPEIQIIEKEKIIYRDRVLVSNNADLKNHWEKKHQSIVDSNKTIVINREKIYLARIERLTKELAGTKEELGTLKQHFLPKSNTKKDAPFSLKNERIEVGVEKKPSVKNPELEMKVFQKQFIENRNNLNSTIFKQ